MVTQSTFLDPDTSPFQTYDLSYILSEIHVYPRGNPAYSFLLYTKKPLARLKKMSWRSINIYSLKTDLEKYFIAVITERTNEVI